MSRRGTGKGIRLFAGAVAVMALQAPVVLAADTAVATAGKVSIAPQEAEAMVAALPAQARAQLTQNPAALEQWVRGRMADKLLLEEASAQQWRQRPEVASQIEAASREIVLRSYLDSVSRVASDYPTEAELKAAYNRTKDQLHKPATYRVSQVFIAAAVNDPAAVTAGRTKATEVVRKARRPKADFSKLIAEYEKGADAPPPDTGWVTIDQLLPEVRATVASLKPGEVSEPVQSAAGFHVLKLVEARPVQTPSFDEAKETLRSLLRRERQQQVARAYLDGLANGADVKVNAEAVRRIVESAGTSATAGRE